MKKYLMTAVAALALGVGFTACSSDEIEPLSQDELLHVDFKNTFLQTFGQVSSNQNWGFKTFVVTDNYLTRSHNVNRNEWGTGHGVGGHVAVPANVTKNEHDLVLAEFSKELANIKTVKQIDFQNFFVHQVHKSDNTYNDGNGNSTGAIYNKMNQIQVRYGDGENNNGTLEGEWEHVNDFNGGTQNADWETIKGATYMENSGTKQFAYHNVVDSKFHSEYIIIAGADIDDSLAGYYYVGFDFYATHPEGQDANKNMDVERDWIFNDWIIRISPGEYDGTGSLGRIIAEDLAAGKSDFDYNDVVFDVNEVYRDNPAENNYQPAIYARITVLAAGGTMPLYVGGREKGREVHELFRVSTKTMVNTNNGTVTKQPVSFVMKLHDCGWNDEVTCNIEEDIPVVVETAKGDITLAAKVGQPAEKVLVGTDYVWCDERQSINDKYFGPEDMRFPKYVQGKYSWNTWYKANATE